MENLARHIIRASFSQERMNYIGQESKVIYKSKDGTNTREFDAVDFIASLASHIPNMGEQTVRYFGFYCNVCRGRRKSQKENELDYIIIDDEYMKGCNKSWAIRFFVLNPTQKQAEIIINFTLIILLKILLLIFYPKYPIFLFRMHKLGQISYLYLGVPKVNFYELVSFFNLNALSSPLMIRIHFDILWTMVADTIYRRFASDLRRFEHQQAPSIFKRFISIPGRVIYKDGMFEIKIRKRSHTPILMGMKKLAQPFHVPWLNNCLLKITWTS